MKRQRDFLLGLLIGIVVCYLVIDWRIGAADAYAKLYATGAMQAYSQLAQCKRQIPSPWPRKRL